MTDLNLSSFSCSFSSTDDNKVIPWKYSTALRQVKDKVLCANEIYNFIEIFNKRNEEKIQLKLNGSFDYASYVPEQLSRVFWDYSKNLIDVCVSINNVLYNESLEMCILREINKQFVEFVKDKLQDIEKGNRVIVSLVGEIHIPKVLVLMIDGFYIIKFTSHMLNFVSDKKK